MRFPRKTVFLRQDLTTRLIDDLFANKDALAKRWKVMSAANPAFPKPRTRATIYRWIDEGVPVTDKDSGLLLFGFCALLDVDLLAIFDFERNGYFRRFSKLRQLIYAQNPVAGGIKALMAMYRPADVWPSDSIARQCYGRRWFSHTLNNNDDWHSSDYILLKAKFLETPGNLPRAVHIAYRRTTNRDTMWRYYGTVLSVEGRLELYNEGGDFSQMPVVEAGEIRFRTYYGGRPVEWRIVSLHAFGLTPVRPFNDMTVIGFNW